MTKIAGKEYSKNTVVSISVGSLIVIFLSLWTLSGIGRPLFAADLTRIETKIDTYQKSTAVQILSIRKSALQSELRQVKRELRNSPEDNGAADDIEKIEDDIDDIDAKITCYRSTNCKVESEI